MERRMHARRLPRVIYGKRFPTMPFTFLTESQIHRDGTANQPQHGESGGMWGGAQRLPTLSTLLAS